MLTGGGPDMKRISTLFTDTANIDNDDFSWIGQNALTKQFNFLRKLSNAILCNQPFHHANLCH
jgi:hypothetical protein